jgi:inosine-uridine nucleoside N-ribohydrolase
LTVAVHPTPLRLVVDTDTGIDDALALLLLAARPDVELVAVTTTHGNCTTEQSTANARRVLEVCGLAHVPVTGGISAPLVGELSVAAFVHGEDGLGDCGEAPPPAPPAPPGSTAVEAILDLADRQPGELDLLALGPLTNIGAAVRLDPEVLGAFRTVTVMGGIGPRLPAGAPDPTQGVGDPNTYHDPEAARLVAAAPAGNVVLAGVDVTMGVAAGPDHLARIAGATTAHGRFAARIIEFYVDFYERAYGRRALTLHDPLAAIVAAGGEEVGCHFVEGHAVVEGPAGREACVLEPAADGQRVTRALAGCDAELVAEAMTGALERPLPSRAG